MNIKEIPGMSFDRSEFFRLHMDTPIAPPADALRRMNLAPGTCVKTGPYRQEVCGRVHTNPNCEKEPKNNEAVVIGFGWDSSDEERFTWRGTYQQFLGLWQID